VGRNRGGTAALLTLAIFLASAAAATEVVQLPFGQEKWTGDLDGMIERQKIRVLVVDSRTHYFVDGAVQHGLSYDAVRAFEDELNRAHHAKAIRTEAIFIPVRPDEIIPALLEGRGDLAAANLTITAERAAQVDFGKPFLTHIREIVVTGPASPELHTTMDLLGKDVFVRASSSYWEHLKELSGTLQDADERPLWKRGPPPIRLHPAPEALEDEDLLEMLNAGLVPLVVVDDELAHFWAQLFPKIEPRDDLAVHESGEIAWAFRRDSPQLKAAVDAFVAKHGVGTGRANAKLREYLKSTRYVNDARSTAARQRFDAVAKHFQSYAAQYGFDWLLVTAQGYRESGLDQNARSPVGAIGIMQLMPETGAEMRVGDIHQAEHNVHAGVKYMRRMLDTYFPAARFDEQNRALFAFASYNAGPGRVLQLQKEAAKEGLDPNQWFGNVEKVAARRIGQETVRYVRDIYKYYVAYRLDLELVQERERRKKDATVDEAQAHESGGKKP
jgi:membrane-bound lytic murein transglycosylase MltF